MAACGVASCNPCSSSPPTMFAGPGGHCGAAGRPRAGAQRQWGRGQPGCAAGQAAGLACDCHLQPKKLQLLQASSCECLRRCTEVWHAAYDMLSSCNVHPAAVPNCAWSGCSGSCALSPASPRRQLGADETHDYRDASLLAKLYGKGGRQFDVVFEAVGGEWCGKRRVLSQLCVATACTRGHGRLSQLPGPKATTPATLGW